MRIAFEDQNSRQSLLDDGWREIETLNLYERSGLPAGWPRNEEKNRTIAVNVAEPSKDFLGFVSDVGPHARSGRLWRDYSLSPVFVLDTYRQWIKKTAANAGTTRLLATWCGQNAGFMLLVNEERGPRIDFFAVEPEFRGRGIGKALLAQACAMCGPTLRAGTASDNAAAVHLYLTHGFVLVGRQRTFHK